MREYLTSLPIAQALIDLVRGGRIREGGLTAKMTTENDLAEMAKHLEEWMVRDDASIAMMHGEIIIQK
jgi:hypothetical protein